MRHYSPFELRQALEHSGLTSGDVVLVHSSLMHFGRLRDCSSDQVASVVYEALRDVIGNAGTIVVPTFTFEFARGEPFNPKTSKSVGMGALSEYVRQLPEARRSAHPMQSVAAIGPAAIHICEYSEQSSFCEGGVFDKILSLRGRGLLLGCGIQSFSMVHLAEERCSVPYRYWKLFSGPYGDPATMKKFPMLVRDLNLNPKLKLSRIAEVLEARKQIVVAPIGASTVRSFRLDDFMGVAMQGLQCDPFWLVASTDV